MDEKTRFAAARLSRETLPGQLSLIDAEPGSMIAEQHLQVARRLLRDLLGAVEVPS